MIFPELTQKSDLYPSGSQTDRVLRTDVANFSASGLKRQDYGLIVIKGAQAASKFKRIGRRARMSRNR